MGVHFSRGEGGAIMTRTGPPDGRRSKLVHPLATVCHSPPGNSLPSFSRVARGKYGLECGKYVEDVQYYHEALLFDIIIH